MIEYRRILSGYNMMAGGNAILVNSLIRQSIDNLKDNEGFISEIIRELFVMANYESASDIIKSEYLDRDDFDKKKLIIDTCTVLREHVKNRQQRMYSISQLLSNFSDCDHDFRHDVSVWLLNNMDLDERWHIVTTTWFPTEAFAKEQLFDMVSTDCGKVLDFLKNSKYRERFLAAILNFAWWSNTMDEIEILLSSPKLPVSMVKSVLVEFIMGKYVYVDGRVDITKHLLKYVPIETLRVITAELYLKWNDKNYMKYPFDIRQRMENVITDLRAEIKIREEGVDQNEVSE